MFEEINKITDKFFKQSDEFIAKRKAMEDKTKPEEWEIMIQRDLDDGKFGMICSSETHFKNYIYPIIKQWTDDDYQQGWIDCYEGRSFKGKGTTI